MTGRSSIELPADLDADGIVDSKERILYSIYDFIGTDKNLDMARRIGGSGRQLFAENIQGFGIAFAFDDDFDKELDTYAAGAAQQIIWAIDSDGDNDLDTNLDTNQDGIIDINDSPGLDGTNGIIQGRSLDHDVSIKNIRAVRIWILAKTDHSFSSSNNQKTYIVGKYVITLKNKNIRLLSTIVHCRNLRTY